MNDPLIEKLVARIETLESLIREQLLTQKAALTFNEAVQYMGISESQLYRLTWQRVIPTFKPGGKLLFFKRSDLDNWMLSKRRKSDHEIKSEAIYKLKHS